MKMKNKLQTFYLELSTVMMSVSFVVVFAISSSGQQGSQTDKSKTWIAFSPSSRSFTIELPDMPEQQVRAAVPDAKGEIDDELTYFKCTKSVTLYSLRAPDKSAIVSISEIDVSGCPRKDSDFIDEIAGLFAFIGGDRREALSDKTVSVNGLPGREIIYKNGSKVLGHTLAIDAGKRIYLLNYDRLRGNTWEEERVFRSFQPTASP